MCDQIAVLVFWVQDQCAFPTCWASYWFPSVVIHRSAFERLRPELCTSWAFENLEHVAVHLGGTSCAKLVLLCVCSLFRE